MGWRDKLSDQDRERIEQQALEATEGIRSNPDYQPMMDDIRERGEQSVEIDHNINDPNHPGSRYQETLREGMADQNQPQLEAEPTEAQLEAEQARDMEEIEAAKSPEQREQERADYEAGLDELAKEHEPEPELENDRELGDDD